jgi:mono/diheme cytochrome c family protein
MTMHIANERDTAPWAVLALLALMALPTTALAQEGGEVTYSRDIAPILQENCQVCHSDGAIAPFALDDYDDARRYARRIRQAVDDRLMPPWHINHELGIQDFKNDRSLEEDEIEAILAWIDNGMLEGDPRDLPAPKEFPSGEDFMTSEILGPPDLVIVTDRPTGTTSGGSPRSRRG